MSPSNSPILSAATIRPIHVFSSAFSAFLSANILCARVWRSCNPGPTLRASVTAGTVTLHAILLHLWPRNISRAVWDKAQDRFCQSAELLMFVFAHFCGTSWGFQFSVWQWLAPGLASCWLHLWHSSSSLSLFLAPWMTPSLGLWSLVVCLISFLLACNDWCDTHIFTSSQLAHFAPNLWASSMPLQLSITWTQLSQTSFIVRRLLQCLRNANFINQVGCTIQPILILLGNGLLYPQQSQ